MHTPSIAIMPAPAGALSLLATAACLPVLEGASEGALVGVSVLAFREGPRITTHSASFVRHAAGSVWEEELSQALPKGQHLVQGLLDVDPALTTAYALLRDAFRLGAADMPSWTQTTKQSADIRTVWALPDAVVVLDTVCRLEDPSLDWDAHAYARSVVYYDAGAHPEGPPPSVMKARDLAQRHIAKGHAWLRAARVEHADLL